VVDGSDNALSLHIRMTVACLARRSERTFPRTFLTGFKRSRIARNIACARLSLWIQRWNWSAFHAPYLCIIWTECADSDTGERLYVVVDAGETEAFEPAMPSDRKKWSGVSHPGGLHSIYCSSIVKMEYVLFSEQE
jgi:hypothetical protein